MLKLEIQPPQKSKLADGIPAQEVLELMVTSGSLFDLSIALRKVESYFCNFISIMTVPREQQGNLHINFSFTFSSLGHFNIMKHKPETIIAEQE